MIKKRTGRIIQPKEYHKLNHCVTCLKASTIKYGEKCEDCIALNLKYCEVCETVLREGLHQFYSYDNEDVYRENGVTFIASKATVKEFVSTEMLPPLQSDIFCSRHITDEFIEGMKDVCFWCDNDFFNSRANYIFNGNTCEDCAIDLKRRKLNITREVRK